MVYNPYLQFKEELDKISELKDVKSNQYSNTLILIDDTVSSSAIYDILINWIEQGICRQIPVVYPFRYVLITPDDLIKQFTKEGNLTLINRLAMIHKHPEIINIILVKTSTKELFDRETWRVLKLQITYEINLIGK